MLIKHFPFFFTTPYIYKFWFLSVHSVGTQIMLKQIGHSAWEQYSVANNLLRFAVQLDKTRELVVLMLYNIIVYKTYVYLISFFIKTACPLFPYKSTIIYWSIKGGLKGYLTPMISKHPLVFIFRYYSYSN